VGSVGIGFSGEDWIQLAKDTVQWRGFVNTVRKTVFHKVGQLANWLLWLLSNTHFDMLQEYSVSCFQHLFISSSTLRYSLYVIFMWVSCRPVPSFHYKTLNANKIVIDGNNGTGVRCIDHFDTVGTHSDSAFMRQEHVQTVLSLHCILTQHLLMVVSICAHLCLLHWILRPLPLHSLSQAWIPKIGV
jgi:hypothetical protein